MREYKFRGKRKDNGQWIYGSYHYCDQKGIMRTRQWGTVMNIIEKEVQFNNHWIFVHHTPDSPGWDVRDSFVPHEVIPETVGIHFGWADSNGTDIYTGDQLELFWSNGESTRETVSYSHKYGYFMYGNNPLCELVDSNIESKVVGNIHELLNPLEGERINTMQNFDPNVKTEGEVKETAEAQPAEQATEGTQEAEEVKE